MPFDPLRLRCLPLREATLKSSSGSDTKLLGAWMCVQQLMRLSGATSRSFSGPKKKASAWIPYKLPRSQQLDPQHPKWFGHNCDLPGFSVIWNGSACTLAAADILEWLHERSAPWHEPTCACAALMGHLEVLQWLRMKGCPWDAGTCALAAQAGRLEVLKWAREQGCPWDKWACAGAALGGVEVVERARLSLGQGSSDDQGSFGGQSGGVEVAERARLSLEHPSAWEAAARGGHLEVVQWLQSYATQVHLCRYTRRSS